MLKTKKTKEGKEVVMFFFKDKKYTKSKCASSISYQVELLISTKRRQK